ncbi:hypothetical protein PG993_009225 [Apiospora rasikravindrae]|uniref:Uncharacterized protein n=1 Tax=Apiospora rasikravindrae TaxID=990691 RepID=A0ABR1SIT0_9PEZI
MPSRATPGARREASVATSSGSVARQNFGDFNDQQLQALAHELGEWETETSCVRKNCAHRPPSMCWNQEPVYPVDTKQPSFYLPGVIESLPESLSNNRKQWMYTCLLAKHYRVPLTLSFSTIKPYNNLISPIQKARKKDVRLDAYMLCILYTAGQFIDKRELLLDRLAFLKPYPSKNQAGFDWKFEENRDRAFRWYDDGHWEEHPADKNPNDDELRHVKVELTLVYSQLLGPVSAEGAHVNEFQKEVARALKAMLREETDDTDGEATDSQGEGMDHSEELLLHGMSSRAQSMVTQPGRLDEPQDAPIQDQQPQQAHIGEPANHFHVFKAKLNDALKDLFQAQGAQPPDGDGLEGDKENALIVDEVVPSREDGKIDNEGHNVAEKQQNQSPAAGKEDANEAHHMSAKPVKLEFSEPNGTFNKIKNDPDSKADVENARLREDVQRYQREAATMKRKFEETFEELGQQREQHNKMVQDTKKELSRSSKRQKLLHVHIESIYNKWDTGKLLKDGENGSEFVMDHVHEALDLVKLSMADERAKVRKILELEDQGDVHQQLQVWSTQREATMGERMDALEKLLTSEPVTRPMDVATELKESYSTWVKSVKPRLDLEPPRI